MQIFRSWIQHFRLFFTDGWKLSHGSVKVQCTHLRAESLFLKKILKHPKKKDFFTYYLTDDAIHKQKKKCGYIVTE